MTDAVSLIPLTAYARTSTDDQQNPFGPLVPASRSGSTHFPTLGPKPRVDRNRRW
jgi:hypothetical protein